MRGPYETAACRPHAERKPGAGMRGPTLRFVAFAVRQVTTPVKPLTYDEVQQFPDDGLRYELVDGELLVTPSPNLVHQRIVLNLAVILRGAVGADLEVLIAPFDWLVSPRTFFEPDVIVFRREDVTERNLPVPPVLAVEVLSPGTRHRDVGLKKRAYEDAGLPHYWVVDPGEPSMTAFALREGRFAEVGSAGGDDLFDVTDPFPVQMVPGALIR